MTLFIRYCEDCNRAFPCVELTCPGCGEEKPSYDAGKLIEDLADGGSSKEEAPEPDGEIRDQRQSSPDSPATQASLLA